MHDSEVCKTLADLIRINSINPAFRDGVTERTITDYIEGFFQRRGIETFRQQVALGRDNLVARIRGRTNTRRLLLDAHVDTASVDGMTIEPFDAKIAEGRMYGRGSCDDKGPLAAMMHAMAEIASQASPPDCEVWMLASVDEEYGFNGIKRFVEEFTADAAIVAEATQLRQVTAAKGCIFGSFVVDGRAAHGSVPQLGVNAINATAKIILAIAKDNQRLADSPHPLLGAGTCNVGVVAGGVQANIVAEQCRVEFDRRLVPGETADELLRCYNRLAQESQGLTSGLTIRFEPPRLSLVPWETPVSAPLVVAATQALKQLGLNAQPLGVPYCSHANVLAAGGIPSIILGPGSIEQAHAAVEFVDCQQLEQSVAIYREIIRNF